MPFFDFIDTLPRYASIDRPQANRLNLRRRFIIGPVKPYFKNARVLDLASHDGRWCYAFAAAGAREVVGFEGRQELIDSFPDFPDEELRNKVQLHCTDIFDGLDAAIAEGERFDVVGVLGIYYHIMDHQRLLKQIRAVKPKLVIIDSEFSTRDNPIIQLVQERTDQILNAIPEYDGHEIAVKGVPSFRAMELMADSAGFDLEWNDVSDIPRGRRGGVADYYRKTNMRRATCFLRPKGDT
ncbi:tRNA (mo5U34)-methyltransferase [Ascidiaceihabitans donghaensis]|uniref:tRNA (Mo5U34)-methyltransferase n=1 Tax=Ascidiaceihabitans donghaensis TaxID=1510460 RepID=A0A2R8B916_9RHOB|nr:class I SAM-dependent methyltransferase [Ascidiaceihabitans donghaensis]SPH19565.1 tRNA (mo5U34)-methyltransferase [Ascidiaceihabitans donghaensis]